MELLFLNPGPCPGFRVRDGVREPGPLTALAAAWQTVFGLGCGSGFGPGPGHRTRSRSSVSGSGPGLRFPDVVPAAEFHPRPSGAP
ncbi:MAG: hypothetical protein DRJ65_05505 [Acidobacteria bacterium]|nr:MAG: hypothetical protein DRJ65_05505 [Acidobacteriota bacterium]